MTRPNMVTILIGNADVRAATASLVAASVAFGIVPLPDDCWQITVKHEHAALVLRFAHATLQSEAAYSAALQGEIRRTLTAQLALWDGIAAIECLVFMREQLAGDAELPIDEEIKTICTTLDRRAPLPDQAVADVMEAITRLLDA